MRCRSCGRCCWRRSTGAGQGLRADVVILNDHPVDYLDALQAELVGAVAGRTLGRTEGLTRRRVPPAIRGHGSGRPRPAVRPSHVSCCTGSLGCSIRRWIVRRAWLYEEHLVTPAAGVVGAAERLVSSRRFHGWSLRTDSVASHLTAVSTWSCSSGDRETPLAVVQRDRQPGFRHDRDELRLRRSVGPRTVARIGSRRSPTTRSRTRRVRRIYLRDNESGAVWSADTGSHAPGQEHEPLADSAPGRCPPATSTRPAGSRQDLDGVPSTRTTP